MRNDAELAAIFRRFLERGDAGNYVATNGPSTDAVLILDGAVDLQGEDEYQAVQEAVEGA